MPVESAAAKTPVTAGAPRVLVVDDHALMRRGLALVITLRFPGATVIEAGSLAEAVRLAQEESDLSAVLFDLQMGDTEGLPGVEAMLHVLDGVPLVVISGTLDASLIAACIRAGARGFLPKGSEAEALDHALPVVLSGGIYAPLPRGATVSPSMPPPTPGILDGLTARQREILVLLLEGRSNKEIARSLGILEGTIKVHLRSVMQRLGVHNRTQLALLVSRAGPPS
ncbi:hypothetical protein TSO221_14200 [Azospirillum sp. TSO22-1]|nr:hypothetical protein TSO221_14200 [Azospirillum sp. TSO22-1]